MAFCTNCGHQLAEGAKFCFECGAKVDTMNTAQAEQRKEYYDGEIHKCPHCGEPIRAFMTMCPSCGHELRGTKNSDAVQEFAAKLSMAGSHNEEVTIIKNFLIPNTKEDIIEFLILASTNVGSNLDNELSDAWTLKVEQAYKKAQLMLRSDEDFSYIESVYNQVCDKLKKDKQASRAKNARSAIAELAPVLPNVIIVVAWLLCLFILLPLCGINVDSAGANGYQLLFIAIMIAGVFLVPLALRKEALLPRLVAILGLVLSVVVLIPLYRKNQDSSVSSAYLLLLLVDIICSVIIFARILKHKTNSPSDKTPLNGNFVVVALVCMVLLLVGYGISAISASIIEHNHNKANQEEYNVIYEWPESGLSTMLPRPETNYGKIVTDDENRFCIELYKVTQQYFDDYANKCKVNGFSLYTTKTDSLFYGYTEEKYSLDLFFDEETQKLKLYLDVPEKMVDLYWPTSKVAQQIPTPQSLKGRIWDDSSNSFGVNVDNTDATAFAAYIDACMRQGFTVDYVREDDYFNAYNKDGYELTLHLKIFDVMEIHIELPSED